MTFGSKLNKMCTHHIILFFVRRDGKTNIQQVSEFTEEKRREKTNFTRIGLGLRVAAAD